MLVSQTITDDTVSSSISGLTAERRIQYATPLPHAPHESIGYFPESNPLIFHGVDVAVASDRFSILKGCIYISSADETPHKRP